MSASESGNRAEIRCCASQTQTVKLGRVLNVLVSANHRIKNETAGSKPVLRSAKKLITLTKIQKHRSTFTSCLEQGLGPHMTQSRRRCGEGYQKRVAQGRTHAKKCKALDDWFCRRDMPSPQINHSEGI